MDVHLTVYGLESPGIEGHNQIPETVEALAQHHLATIKAVQPNGPYYLIGYSFGSEVALEMAWCLEQAGETIALLAIFDQPTPQETSEKTDMSPLTELDCLWRIVDGFKNLAHIEPPWCLDDLKQTNSLSYAYRTVMNWLKQENAHEILFSNSGLPEELQAYVRIYRANWRAFSAYQSQNKRLRCPIELFCTAESLSTWRDQKPSDNWGWKAHTLTEVKMYQVTGSHFSMLTQPHVQGLANKLTNILKTVVPT